MGSTLGRVAFIKKYMESGNPATASDLDANANIENKNIATLSNELGKFDNVLTNRRLVMNKISELFDEELANEYERQIEAHEIYIHDETSLMPYCVSINMYPFLKDGLLKIGGESAAPKNLNSFCGSFINLMFAVSSQFAGAVASVEFLMYFDYFARLEFGERYALQLDNTVYTTPTREYTIRDMIFQYFQQVVYSINQPAAARGYQAVFWNISVFDAPYFESMFGNFFFPDGTQPVWGSLKDLQVLFMDWFNEERTKAVLTFPVVTAAMLTDDNDLVDQDNADMIANQLSKGNSFFMYLSDSADSLASCCRLRNEISDNTFSYSLGAGGVSTGSVNVITMNLNRLVQKDIDIEATIAKIHKYHVAYRSLIKEYEEAGLLPVYDAGFIQLDKQFCTIGINGMVEAAEFKGIDISVNEDYQTFIASILKPLYTMNKAAYKTYGFRFNTEFVPAENLGVKNSKWDFNEGLINARSCYNSYFFKVEDTEIDVVDKFKLHGKESVRYLDGGSALHLNLDDHLNKEQYRQLLKVAVKTGCNYWTVNVKNTICNACGHIDKTTLKKCKKCSSTDVDYATRVIGYLKRISSFSESRQVEQSVRTYHKEC